MKRFFLTALVAISTGFAFTTDASKPYDGSEEAVFMVSQEGDTTISQAVDSLAEPKKRRSIVSRFLAYFNRIMQATRNSALVSLLKVSTTRRQPTRCRPRRMWLSSATCLQWGSICWGFEESILRQKTNTELYTPCISMISRASSGVSDST